MTAPASPGTSPIRRIPVTLLTGFLGSGKTTVLRQLLRDPDWTDAAVLINELGAVGLDHTLVWGASGTMHVLENGCICCSARDDLVTTLEDLFWSRLQRKIPRFNRVVIETTGLADPGPVIRELFSHALIAERYFLESVVCTVDAVLGAGHLETHPESLAQAASADVILLTKTDLAAPAAALKLETRLREMNPLAAIERSVAGMARAELLAKPGSWSEPGLDARLRRRDQPRDSGAAGNGDGENPRFHRRVQSTVLRFTHPWERAGFEQALRATIDAAGDQLLRIKGLIALDDDARPLVVQVVQNMIFPFESLPVQAAGAAQNFLVCIALGIASADLRRFFLDHLGVETSANMLRRR